MMKSHLSSKKEYCWLFYGLIFLQTKNSSRCAQIPNDKKPFTSTSSREMESSLEENMTGSWPCSLFHQELSGSLVVTEWFHHMAGSCHHHLKLRAKLMQTWARRHGQDKGKEQSVIWKKAFPTPALRFAETTWDAQLWGKLLTSPVMVASWVLLTLLLLVWLFSANPRQDATLPDWSSDLCPNAEWVTKINTENQIIVFGPKHPFVHFRLPASLWNYSLEKPRCGLLSLLVWVCFLKWYMPYVQESNNSVCYWLQLEDD